MKAMISALVLGLTFLVACSLPTTDKANKQVQPHVFRDDAIAQMIQGAQSVEAAKVSPAGIDREKVLLSKDEVVALQALLLNEENYITEYQKKCVFFAETAFLFEGNPGLTMYVGVHCKQMKVSYNNQEFVLEIDPMVGKLHSLSQEILGRRADKNQRQENQ